MKPEVDNPKHSNGNGNIEKATPPVDHSKSVAENPSETSIKIGMAAPVDDSRRVAEHLPTTLINALSAILDKIIKHKVLIIYPLWLIAFLSIFDKTWREDIKHLYMWVFDEPEPIVTWIIALLQNNF